MDEPPPSLVEPSETEAASKSSSAATAAHAQAPAAARTRPEIIAELEACTRSIFDRFNERNKQDFTADGMRAASDFRAIFTGGGVPFSYDEMLQYQRQVLTAMPDYRLDVLTTSVDLNKSETYAKVFALCEVTRAPDEIRGENTCVLEYRRAGDGWHWCRFTNIRAPTGIGIADPVRTR